MSSSVSDIVRDIEADIDGQPFDTWLDEIHRLRDRRSAVILAHNYTTPEIQAAADHVGDSLALSRLAAASDAAVIVFAGVAFMAETAKILAPDRTVLLPDPAAGCSLSESITAEQLRDWKAEHPGAAVVAYVNTSAEVKAEADVCCTSANAVEVVAAIPAEREVLFLPDQFLGAHVRRGDRAGEPPRVARRVPRPCRNLWSAAPRASRGVARGRATRSPRVWLRDVGSMDGRDRRAAALADAHPLDRRDARARSADHGGARARRHRNRHAASAPSGEPVDPLRAGQRAGVMPLHEDDDSRCSDPLPARRRARGRRRSSCRRARPPRGRGHACLRQPVPHRRMTRGERSRSPRQRSRTTRERSRTTARAVTHSPRAVT